MSMIFLAVAAQLASPVINVPSPTVEPNYNFDCLLLAENQKSVRATGNYSSVFNKNGSRTISVNLNTNSDLYPSLDRAFDLIPAYPSLKEAEFLKTESKSSYLSKTDITYKYKFNFETSGRSLTGNFAFLTLFKSEKSFTRFQSVPTINEGYIATGVCNLTPRAQ